MEGKFGRRCALVVGSITAGVILAVGVLGVPVAMAETAVFADVGGDEWFAEAATALAAEGIIMGRDDGSFGPHDPVTRAQMAAFVARALQSARLAPCLLRRRDA